MPSLLFAIDVLDIADEMLLDKAKDELRGSALDCASLLAMDELLTDEVLSVDVLHLVELLLPLPDTASSPADEPPQDTKLSESARTPSNRLSFITFVQCTLIHVVHDRARAGVVFPVRWRDQCVSMVQKLSTRLGFLYPPASQVLPAMS